MWVGVDECDFFDWVREVVGKCDLFLAGFGWVCVSVIDHRSASGLFTLHL